MFYRIGRPPKGKPVSSFYRHKEGRCTCTGRSQKSSSSPRIAGVQWSSTVGSTLWAMASGVAVVLGIVLGLAEITPRPDSPSRRRGHRCRVYRLPGVAWRRSVGPAGQGLAYICAPAVVGHVAVPGPLGWSASACAKGVRESRGGPGPLEGGGPGLRLLVLSIPPWGTRGDAGSLPEQGTGPGSVW